jgi:hypothetical protein
MMKINPTSKIEKTVTKFKYTKASIQASIADDLASEGYRIKELSWNVTNTALDVTAEKIHDLKASKKS